MRLLAGIIAQMLGFDIIGYRGSISLSIDCMAPVSARDCQDGPRKKVGVNYFVMPDDQYAQVKGAVLIHISASEITPYRHQIDEKRIGARQIHSHARMEGGLLA
jgi:hypothetical protein